MHSGENSWSWSEKSGGFAQGASGSEIKLGDGDNSLSIDVEAGSRAEGLIYSDITGGDGDDTVKISSNASGGRSYGHFGRHEDAGTYSSEWRNVSRSSYWSNYSYNRWGRGYSSDYTNESEWMSNGLYENNYTSSNEYKYEHSRRWGSSIGVAGSSIHLGNGENSVELDAHGGENARGLIDSEIVTGDGDDTISILTRADGEDSYSNTSMGEYSSENIGLYEYSNTYQYSYGSSSSRWYGNNSNSNSWRYQNNNSHEHSSRGSSEWDYEYSRVHRFGSAVGTERSKISAGDGNNTISISAVGGELAIALANTKITAGDGNDTLLINSAAEGENSYTSMNRSSGNWDSRYENKYGRNEEYTRSYASAYYWYNQIEEREHSLSLIHI